MKIYESIFFQLPLAICVAVFEGKEEVYFFSWSSTPVVHASARAQGPPPKQINNPTLFLPVAYGANLSYFYFTLLNYPN